MLKPTRVVVKVVLVTTDGKTLILRRSESDERRPLQWDIAGGAVDKGESHEQAACRETLEETGIVITPESIELGYAKAAMTERGNVCWLFYAAELHSEQSVTLSQEHDDYKWVTFDEALRLITYDRQQDAIRHIITHVLA